MDPLRLTDTSRPGNILDADARADLAELDVVNDQSGDRVFFSLTVDDAKRLRDWLHDFVESRPAAEPDVVIVLPNKYVSGAYGITNVS